MTEQVREHYFLAVRACMVLIVEIYILISQFRKAEPTAMVVLLLSLLFCVVVLKELLPQKIRFLSIFVIMSISGWLMYYYGSTYLLLYIVLTYEIMSLFHVGFICYFIPIAIACAPSQEVIYVKLLFTVLIGIIYIQHNYIVASYRSQKEDDFLVEQKLKKDIFHRETVFREKLNRSLLQAENQMLDEKDRLSQTLHDKLGHNINGSIYQLEAVKVILDKDPDNSRQRIQAVIDQLRTGMDEIRLILRRERPAKCKLTLIQLQKLCDECSQAGVVAELDVKGELSDVPDKYLEIVLDNIFEGVTNSLKYSKCTKIIITIHIMNEVIRCRVSDNGVGCREIVDGMGIAGMRQRIRNVGGVLDFETEVGFTINMLLPIKPKGSREDECNS